MTLTGGSTGLEVCTWAPGDAWLVCAETWGYNVHVWKGSNTTGGWSKSPTTTIPFPAGTAVGISFNQVGSVMVMGEAAFPSALQLWNTTDPDPSKWTVMCSLCCSGRDLRQSAWYDDGVATKLGAVGWPASGTYKNVVVWSWPSVPAGAKINCAAATSKSYDGTGVFPGYAVWTASGGYVAVSDTTHPYVSVPDRKFFANLHGTGDCKSSLAQWPAGGAWASSSARSTSGTSPRLSPHGLALISSTVRYATDVQVIGCMDGAQASGFNILSSTCVGTYSITGLSTDVQWVGWHPDGKHVLVMAAGTSYGQLGVYKIRPNEAAFWTAGAVSPYASPGWTEAPANGAADAAAASPSPSPTTFPSASAESAANVVTMTSTANWRPVGFAEAGSNTAYLTKAPFCCSFTGRCQASVQRQAGALWAPYRVTLNRDISVTFTVTLSEAYGGGADGFSFVFHNDPRGTAALSCTGWAIGLLADTNGETGCTNGPCNAAISPAVGLVAWDGWNTGVYRGGLGTSPSFASASMGSTSDALTVTLRYTASTATLSMSTLAGPVSTSSSLAVDLSSTLGIKVAYLGMTAGTGAGAWTRAVTGMTVTGVLDMLPDVTPTAASSASASATASSSKSITSMSASSTASGSATASGSTSLRPSSSASPSRTALSSSSAVATRSSSSSSSATASATARATSTPSSSRQASLGTHIDFALIIAGLMPTDIYTSNGRESMAALALRQGMAEVLGLPLAPVLLIAVRAVLRARALAMPVPLPEHTRGLQSSTGADLEAEFSVLTGESPASIASTQQAVSSALQTATQQPGPALTGLYASLTLLTGKTGIQIVAVSKPPQLIAASPSPTPTRPSVDMEGNVTYVIVAGAAVLGLALGAGAVVYGKGWHRNVQLARVAAAEHGEDPQHTACVADANNSAAPGRTAGTVGGTAGVVVLRAEVVRLPVSAPPPSPRPSTMGTLSTAWSASSASMSVSDGSTSARTLRETNTTQGSTPGHVNSVGTMSNTSGHQHGHGNRLATRTGVYPELPPLPTAAWSAGLAAATAHQPGHEPARDKDDEDPTAY